MKIPISKSIPTAKRGVPSKSFYFVLVCSDTFFICLRFTLIVADFTKKIATDYGVLKEDDGMSTTGKIVNCAMSNDQKKNSFCF